MTEQNDHLDTYQLNEYLDGCLDPGGLVEIEKHLEACPTCRQRAADLRSIILDLEALPDIPLERDLSQEVLAAIQSTDNFWGQLKWGVAVQAIVALVIMALALPSISKIWQPGWDDLQLALNSQFSEVREILAVDWTLQISIWQMNWSQWSSAWQRASFLETTQIVIWPIFLVAIVLFVVGNGLILHKVARNGVH
jgi:anti-sigma factor RsiW